MTNRLACKKLLLPQLLPPNGKGLFAILFTDDSQESHKAQAEFDSLKLPNAYAKHQVAVEHDCPLCEWFGIFRAPTLAIISQGMLMGISENCSKSSWKELVEFMKHQSLYVSERYQRGR